MEQRHLLAGWRRQDASPVRIALLLSAGYAATAVTWLVVTGALFWPDVVTASGSRLLVIVNGALFVAFTTTVLFVVVERYLRRLSESERRFVEAQRELRDKDLAIRQGYVDVLDAVTGGRLILVTEDEVQRVLGEVLLPPTPLDDARAVASARTRIVATLEALGVREKDSIVLAASEALTNAVKHGGRGEFSLHLSGRCLQIVVRDFGTGIDFRQLPKATLIQGFSTTNTMGLGFTIMLEVADRVLLTTDSDGTVVVLEIELGRPESVKDEKAVASVLASV